MEGIQRMGKEALAVEGRWTFTIHRANGTVETIGPMKNLVPDSGSEQFVKKLLDEQTSRMNYIAVGTVNTAPNMADTTLTGEADRKAMSANATSLNTMVQVSTFGGDADSLTGVVIQEAGTFNHASSGLGQMGNRLAFSTSPVTLAASDILKIELTTTIGSHS